MAHPLLPQSLPEAKPPTKQQVRRNYEYSLRFFVAAGLMSVEGYIAALWTKYPKLYKDRKKAKDPQPLVIGGLKYRGARVKIMRERYARRESLYHEKDGWRKKGIIENLGILVAAGANSASFGGEGVSGG